MPGLNRRQALLGMAGLAAVAAAKPARGQTPSGAAPIDLVRFAWSTDVGVPTPFQISTAGPGGVALLSLIYDTLTWKDAKGIVPWLASAWTVSADGLSYTFQMNAAAAWQDGQPLSAGDVAFSFTYYAAHPFLWMTTEVIAAAKVSAGNTVLITLKRPYAPFLEDIAGVVPIIPKHVWESIADPITYTGSDRSLGSGPFSLAEYNQPEGAYRLVANDAYWRGQPLIKEWRQLTIPAATQVQAVQQGDADIAFSTDASIKTVLAGAARLKVFETAPLSIVRLAVNTKRPPLDAKLVRQAILYALDRKQIAETLTHGPAIVGSAGVIPPETPWHDPAVKQYAYDPDRARALLGGRKLTISLIADANSREPDLMTPMLAAAGITLNVQRVDAATRVQLLEAGDFELALIQHIGVGGDPDYLRRWYDGEESNAFAKGSIFDNAQFTQLGDAESASLDPAKRLGLVVQMQGILAEELPTITLYYRRFYWLYDPKLIAPMETWGGLMNGIPFPNNKIALIGS